MKNLLYKHEQPLFRISFLISALVWLGVLIGTLGIVLLYLPFLFVFYLFVQSAFIAYIKGTAVKITPDQFPDLHERVVACCSKVGVDPVPDTYLMHSDGAFNAFATRFLGRNFVVLFSDVVDALQDRLSALDFYIGHELGHIQRKHLLWGPFLLPSSILPLIGAAYHRAREATCDNFGAACCEDENDALIGLSALAAGSKRWKSLSMHEYIGQARETDGFWMSFHELVADYPYLVKRVARIQAESQGQPTRGASRNPFAYFFALFVPRIGSGGGAAGFAGVIVMMMVMGVIAAITVPALAQSQNRGNELALRNDLQTLLVAQEDYYFDHGTYASEMSQLDFFPGDQTEIEIVEADETCFQAVGHHPSVPGPVSVDCTGSFDPPLR